LLFITGRGNAITVKVIYRKSAFKDVKTGTNSLTVAVAYLLRYNFITKHQHAFLKSRSTATNLLECTEDWMVALTSHHSVDVIYIDFSRAFDSVVFTKLIAKLEHYGITGRLLRLLGFLHSCIIVRSVLFSKTAFLLLLTLKMVSYKARS
jgi:hypothetical protein